MSDYLPVEEWLHLAQRLHVGQKQRVRHCGLTPAMDVYNHDDRWSAYCHRCHTAGNRRKLHQSVNSVRVDENRVSAVPTDALHISQVSGFLQKQIWNLLVQKGCPVGVIPEESIWYSASSNRILLRQGKQALGRALSPRQLPKWLAFGDWYQKPRMWWTRWTPEAQVLVLCEDTLSAYKIAKSVATFSPNSQVSIAATLGTVLTKETLPLVVGRTVVCMYDGDDAGAVGSREMKKRLAVFGGEFYDKRPAKGDPKNMTLEEIHESIKEYY